MHVAGTLLLFRNMHELLHDSVVHVKGLQESTAHALLKRERQCF